MANENLKLALQKKGRLSDKSLELLKLCGISIERYSERLLVSARNFNLDIFFLRDDDIPEYVQNGIADIGIVGLDVLKEKCVNVDRIRDLGFGRCSLMIAHPEGMELENLESLNGKMIATSYPNIVKGFLKQNKLEAETIKISGSVEIAPALEVADLICDIVSTGNTLRFNKLKKSFRVFDSEAVLFAHNGINPEKAALLSELLKRIDSVMLARDSRYLMMNVPKASLNEILKKIPSLKSPTILPLAEDDMLAVHAVIPEAKFWEITDDLKSLGASGILLLSIENMII